MVSFACRTASSSSSKGITATTGRRSPPSPPCRRWRRARAPSADTRNRCLRGGALYRHGRVLGDVGGDGLPVLRGDERAHLGSFVEGVSDLKPSTAGCIRERKSSKTLLLDEDARAGAAVLPGVAEDGGGGFAGGLLQVGVGEDNVRRLAAQLQRYPLYGAGGALGDPLTHLGRAREGYLRDVGMLDEALPDLAPRPYDDVHDALGDAGVLAMRSNSTAVRGVSSAGLRTRCSRRPERGPSSSSLW